MIRAAGCLAKILRQAVESVHQVIHDDNVRFMTFVGLDCFHAGGHYLDHFVI